MRPALGAARAERQLDRESVGKLLVSEYQGLLALLHRKARDPELAADLLNEALIVTLKNFDAGKISDPSGVGGYVFQVAMNLLRNHRRSFGESVAKRAELTDDILADFSVPENTEEQCAENVRALLAELPSSRDRDLLKRFYLDEEEKGSICEKLRISALQFDKIIFRARKRMLSLVQTRGFRKGDLLSFLLGGLLLGV